MRYLLLTLLALSACPVLAQVTPLTVEEAVRAALQSNPRLSAAAHDVLAAQSGVRSARALANPDLVFTPAITRGGSDEELLLQQPLELNGTRSARTGVARAELKQSQAEALTEVRTLVFETKSAYYELLRGQELLAQAQDLLKTAEEFDRTTRRQVEIGTRPGIDATQTGIEVSRARQQATLAESRAATAQAALNTLMGRPPTEPVGRLTAPKSAATSPDRESLLQQALATRSEVAAAEARREGFQQEARLARAQGRPDLAPQVRAGGLTRGVEDAGLGVGITLPFLDYGSRRNRVRQAEASARAQNSRIAATKNQVMQDVEQALIRVRAAEAIVQEYEQGVLEQARRLLQASRVGFETGVTSVIAVLEAQRTYRSVQAEYTNALIDHQVALAELERATGAVPAAELLPRPLAAPAPGRKAK